MSAISTETVLIFRLGSIGDTVIALPCFHALARAYPSHRRVLLTNSLTHARASSAQTVLDGSGLIDEVIYYPVGDFSLRQMRSLANDIRRLRPAFMVYLAERPTLGPVLRDVAFFKAAGLSRIIGVPWTSRSRNCRVDPDTRQLDYEAERLARLLSTVVPVSLGPPNWDFRLTSTELGNADDRIDAVLGAARIPPPIMAMAPGAKLPAKDWGTANWLHLVRRLAVDHRDTALLLVGAPDERALCEALATEWHGPVVNICGVTTPRETAAALRRCQLLVCHDSGPMHLAAAQGTRCVALFGNYNRPRKWYPYGVGHRVIHEPRGVREIDVAHVAAAVDALWLIEAPSALMTIAS